MKRLGKKGTKRTQHLPFLKRTTNKPNNNSTIHPSPAPKPPTTHPDSYTIDLDPSSTTHCTHPHSSLSGTLVQCALMIDAGSTSSRIHIYKFNNCSPSPEYEYKVFKMTQPGLSSFTGNPKGAVRSLAETQGNIHLHTRSWSTVSWRHPCLAQRISPMVTTCHL